MKEQVNPAAQLKPLKFRREGEFRDIPLPHYVNEAIDKHVAEHGTTPDGYLFQGRKHKLAIESDRLVLRKARDTDREGIVEVLTDPEVRAYLGGPRPREGVEGFLDQAGTASATAAPGSYVIADRQTDLLAGILGLGRRTAGRPGHVTEQGGELELSYVLRRGAWGAGLAFEAATAALRAAAEELPDQPVLVVTQTANHRARRLADRLGFQEVSVFEEFDAQQTLAVASLCSFRVL